MLGKLLGPLLLVAAAAAVVAVVRVDGVRRVVLPGPSAGEAQLRAVIPEVNINAATLEDAIESLRRQTGANLVVRPGALSPGLFGTSPVPPDTRVELHLRGVTLAQALSQILLHMPQEGRAEPVGCTVDDGAIIICGGRELARHTCLRVYDVGDLLPADDTPTQSPQGVGPISTLKPQSPRQLAMDELTQLIISFVGLDTWDVNGGTTGKIQVVGDRLVVMQTPQNHAEISRLLQGLRATPGAWRLPPWNPRSTYRRPGLGLFG